MRFLPDLVEAVSEQEQAGAEILALSTVTYHTDLSTLFCNYDDVFRLYSAGL